MFKQKQDTSKLLEGVKSVLRTEKVMSDEDVGRLDIDSAIEQLNNLI